MKKYLLITIDTEIDSPYWKPELPFSLKNIKAVLRLQKLFQKYDIKATYLVTYPVADNKESKSILKEFSDREEIEIGTHLHTWTTPPFLSGREKLKLDYPHRSKLELEKLSTLTQKIETSFGKRPISYRAGRYGFDRESLKYLKDLNYLIDSSITPSINWSSDGGPNFADFTQLKPYFLDENDIKKSGQSSILEVPISIAVNRKLPSFLSQAYCHLPMEIKGLLKKINLIKTIWLRPSIFSFEEMKWLSDYLLDSDNQVLNMMFHSNELLAGTSPYVKTKKQEENFFLNLENILNYLIFQKKLESKTLFGFYQIMMEQKL
jgi:hypothetical protein